MTELAIELDKLVDALLAALDAGDDEAAAAALERLVEWRALNFEAAA